MNQSDNKKLNKELHAHLNGSLSKETLKELGCIDENVKEYSKLQKILDNSSKNTLDECFELFKIAHKATATKENLYKACQAVIKDYESDNVIYLELRTTPRQEENMTKSEYIDTCIKAIKESKSNVLVKLLLSINRAHSKEECQENMELIIEKFQEHPDLIKGVDLSGNPSEGEFNIELFKKAREAGLKISLHCGEIKNNKNNKEEVRKMLEFQPERLGHATYLFNLNLNSNLNLNTNIEIEEENLNSNLNLNTNIEIKEEDDDEEKSKEKKSIPVVEICLTSNVLCGTSPSYKDHHLAYWLKNGLPFCLATDDKGVFSTSLTEEFYIASSTFNLSKEKLFEINYKTVDYSFASDKEKAHLKELLNAWKPTQML